MTARNLSPHEGQPEGPDVLFLREVLEGQNVIVSSKRSVPRRFVGSTYYACWPERLQLASAGQRDGQHQSLGPAPARDGCRS